MFTAIKKNFTTKIIISIIAISLLNTLSLAAYSTYVLQADYAKKADMCSRQYTSHIKLTLDRLIENTSFLAESHNLSDLVLHNAPYSDITDALRYIAFTSTAVTDVHIYTPTSAYFLYKTHKAPANAYESTQNATRVSICTDDTHNMGYTNNNHCIKCTIELKNNIYATVFINTNTLISNFEIENNLFLENSAIYLISSDNMHHICIKNNSGTSCDELTAMLSDKPNSFFYNVNQYKVPNTDISVIVYTPSTYATADALFVCLFIFSISMIICILCFIVVQLFTKNIYNHLLNLNNKIVEYIKRKTGDM